MNVTRYCVSLESKPRAGPKKIRGLRAPEIVVLKFSNRTFFCADLKTFYKPAASDDLELVPLGRGTKEHQRYTVGCKG